MQEKVSGNGAVLLQQGDQVGDAPGVEGGGFELVSELHTSASSLALSSSSRAISRSTTGRQFSNSCGEDFVYDNQRRQRGNDERYADLLLERDDSNEGECDMASACGPQLVELTVRAISTVSIMIASSTCSDITSLAGRDITASDVGP